MAILKYSNRLGFPCIESQSVSLTDTAETFTFDRFINLSPRFQGAFFVKVSNTAATPSTAVSIYFTISSGTSVPLYDAQGVAITTATWPGDGVYLAWYDTSDSKIRILTIS